ncbi:GNAT family N-acetyltransferase [Demequina sp. SYSU T00192]|uniref:GNAT family N-acetyltransferase n=1 Tax=Demequina litoralis TaxID=3051660 RepID=A0ABT8GBR3_9MICO|nr:GNAT family N-acetyltransferase [Demequina sp. SYSU T00192]MDN4476568.1 GNAT family N-acetyltransferase [Demequina sp. SYSU T00192]
MTTEVARSEERGRYELAVDGELAGFADFRLRSGRIVFTHTEIADAYEGRGLGSALAEAALTDAASRGETIVPLCPFIARYLRRHDVPGAEVAWPAG